MLRAILNKSWGQHPTKQQLYGLLHITKTIKVRQTRHAEHCRRSRNELISNVFLRTPSHGRAKAGRPASTYIPQLCGDTGCSPENIPEPMDDRVLWRERVRDIRAKGSIGWWWNNVIFTDKEGVLYKMCLRNFKTKVIFTKVVCPFSIRHTYFCEFPIFRNNSKNSSFDIMWNSAAMFLLTSFTSSNHCRWGLEYSDFIPCKEVNSLSKGGGWIWYYTAPNGDAPDLGSVKYFFIPITPRSILTGGESTCSGSIYGSNISFKKLHWLTWFLVPRNKTQIANLMVLIQKIT